MTAYYNEIDPFKSEVIREAIKAGAIASGDVDERPIEEVRAADLVGYTQCHFFAGGGFWSLALRLAGWPDGRPVWTGSCPCPSFSAAGKGEGFDDARHLWPVWYPLIREHRPPVLFGEQADDAVGFGWLDLVCGEMEAEGYAVAPAVLGAHSAGAPHIRQRIYFVADSEVSERWRSIGESDARRGSAEIGRSGSTLLRGDAGVLRLDQGERRDSGGQEGSRSALWNESHRPGDAIERNQPISAGLEGYFGDVRDWRGPGWLDPHTARSVAEAGATRGFWGDCDWWRGRDEKWRPAGPGIQPLAHGSPARVGRLRMYGDAICIPTAATFIKAYLEARG